MIKQLAACFFSCILLIPFNLSAQKSSESSGGFQVGLNFGVYIPSKYSANYYNGTEKNLNNTKWVLTSDFFYDSIFNAVKAIDTVYIAEDGWPADMRYKISLMPGLYLQYVFNDVYSLCIEFNYMKLTTQDALIFTVPKPFTTFPDHRLYPIKGVEERMYIDLGVKRNFKVSDRTSMFVIGGLNLNNTTVIKSSFYVEEKEYNLINNYINGIIVGPNSQTFNQKQGGIGWGLYMSAGATLRFGNIALEPGFNAHFINVDLEGYKKYRPGAGFYIRFILDNLLSGGE